MLEGFLTRLGRLARAAVLTDDDNAPSRVAAHMVDLGATGWRAWLCEDLGSPDERVREVPLETLATMGDVAGLNLLVLERTDTSWRPPAALPYLLDEAFGSLATPREVRVLAIAALGIRSDSVVWDVGCGTGAFAAEAGLVAREGRVWAVDVLEPRTAACLAILRTFAVDNVRVVRGRAPAVLDALEEADAIFAGGWAGGPRRIVDACLERLWSGGRFAGVTRSTDAAARIHAALRRRGLRPEAIQLHVDRSRRGPLEYRALHPVHLIVATKK